jgi:hypothetical protein
MPRTPAARAANLPYEVAFQANTGSLWTDGGVGTGNQGLGMLAGTSPSITRYNTAGYETAFQGGNGDLWAQGSNGGGDLGLGMMPGTCPALIS